MTNRNDDINRLRTLSSEREEKRKALRSDIARTRDNLRPSRLFQRARKRTGERLAEGSAKAVDGMKSNPALTAAAVAAAATGAALIAFRKPLSRLIGTRRENSKSPHRQQGAAHE